MIEKEETFGWEHTFESTGLEAADPYEKEELIEFDESISMLVVNFRAQFPWSSQIEDLIGNQTNELRYVEVRLWEPGVKEAGGDPFWEIETSSAFAQTRFTLGNGTKRIVKFDFGSTFKVAVENKPIVTNIHIVRLELLIGNPRNSSPRLNSWVFDLKSRPKHINNSYIF